jgi:hypothetical protein
MTVRRDGTRMYSQLTGQPEVEIFAEAPGKFFLKVVDAQLTFDDAATQLTLHQNGRDITAKRLSGAELTQAKEAITAREAEIAKRTQENKPAAGTEAALRRSIEELRRGEPDYDRMAPALANLTRQQLPGLKKMFENLGAIQSVTFKSVGPNGMDVYEVKFENGSLESLILLGPLGKTQSLGFQAH